MYQLALITTIMKSLKSKGYNLNSQTNVNLLIFTYHNLIEENNTLIIKLNKYKMNIHKK
jgi:hypothetical protein